MEELHYSEVAACYQDFFEAIGKLVGREGVEVPQEILVDDRSTPESSDKLKTNGRYLFQQPEVCRDHYIPHADSPGVYFFFNAEGKALYVGKSEVKGGIGRRVAAHIGRMENESLPYLAFEEAESVIVVPFDYAPWLAPAFESYLLGKRKFKHNLSLSARERCAS